MANGTWWEQTNFLYFDATTGGFLTSVEVSDDLRPWHTETLPPALIPYAVVGDYDGDGYSELATRIYLASEDSSSTTIPPHALVLIGQKTLFGPNLIQVGSVAGFDIALPHHGHSNFHLFFSTGFSPRTDFKQWKPQNWPTMLKNSNVLQRTASIPSLSGILDGDGQGSINVQFPNNPAYIGIQFYARALIGSPNHPGKIIAQSSPHTLELTN